MELYINNLHAGIEGKRILNGVNLKIKSGEVHAIMGPNGSGKSSLSYTIMGHPKYRVDEGDILVDGKGILGLSADKRAKLGIFLGFQYPQEIEGVRIPHFLRTALTSMGKEVQGIVEFHKIVKGEMKRLGMPEEFLNRGVNYGFSGGEKKRSEMLQLTILKPGIAILDEPDSGTDVDGLKAIADSINAIKENTGVLIITHYNRILNYIKPDFVHILTNGKIAYSGGPELAVEIEKKGYGEANAN